MAKTIRQRAVSYAVQPNRAGWQPSIKELPLDLRPRQRLAYAGPEAMSTAELLAILLVSGGKEENAIRMAERLLVCHDGLRGLAQMSYHELCTVHNIGPAKAAQVQAAVELSKRIKASSLADNPRVMTPLDIANLLILEMGLLEQEQLRVVMLNTKNHILSIQTLYVGNLNSAIIRVGEIFREPIRRNAATIVLVHNHPSGDPSPSAEDIAVTQMSIEAGKLLDIEVLDHLVIGRNCYVSLKERRLGF